MKVFISHASEDKNTVARPIAHALRELGYEVWFDEFSLKLGDSLRRSIEGGLRDCNYGVVILSPNFFAKEWPQKELDALTAKEVADKKKVILPVWHQVDAPFIARHSSTLSDKLGVSTGSGMAKVVIAIREVLGPSAREDEVTFDNFIQWSTSKWITIQNLLFPGSIPESSSWTRLEDIIRVLDQISVPNVNHMYLPKGGGMDMDSATSSLEDGCIELKVGSETIWLMKPRELQFESFPPYYSMSYFRLETEEIKPTGLYGDLMYQREELVEIEPLHYLQRSVWDENGYYNEKGDYVRLNEDARLVIRWFKGNFLVANKGSLFNHMHGQHDAYTGRYNAMSRKELRGFMRVLINTAVQKNALTE